MADQVEVNRSWARLTSRVDLRNGLVRCSVYLTSYELLCTALVHQPKEFFTLGLDANDSTIEEYRKHVLSLDEHQYTASAKWFRDMGALTDEDVGRVLEVRARRNHVAHEIPRIILEASEVVPDEWFHDVLELVSKIDRWWIREIEIPANALLDELDISDLGPDDAVSMRMLILQLILATALGNEGEPT